MSPDNLYIIVSSVFVVVIGYDIINWLKDRTIVAPEIRLKRLRSKINTTVLILGLTTLVVSILFHINFLRYSPPIPFSDIDKITLKHFKGYRKPYQTLHGEKQFAFITTTLSCEANGNAVEVQALFHPSRSYVFNDKIVDRFLLKHELYHFRITEVFARRCRKALSQSKYLPSGSEINEIISTNEEDEDEMQTRYDFEAYHGYVMKQQTRWEKEVDSLLNLLNEYQTPIIRYE
jgi:hypothetical protein